MKATITCPDYFDKKILGNPKREGYYDELLAGEVITELYQRTLKKPVEEWDPYEDEAHVIMHLQSYVDGYERKARHEILRVLDYKRRGMKPDTIKHHREMAIYMMEERDRIKPTVERRKKELIEAIKNGIELNGPRLINDGR